MEETEKQQQIAEEYKKPDRIFGVRHVQVSLYFMLLAIGYGMRVNLSVGINAMTDRSATKNPDVPVYDWDDKSVVLSSFFWGYVMLQLVAGQLGKTYGPKWFLVVVMLVNSLGSALTPLMADKFGSKGVMGCRIVQGLFQGFLYPSIHNLLGKWAPTPERSTMSNIAFAGSPFGIIITMPITGFISASWYGWPWAFYLFGIVGVLWVIIWIAFGYNCPSDHKSISEEERNYIIYSINSGGTRQEVPTPWKLILKSLPVWAILVTNLGQNWGFSTLLTEIPSYLNGVMHFDMASNGILSAAPYLALLILGFLFGPIADALINRRILSRGAVRKIFNTIGVCVPAFALLALGYVPDNQQILSVTLLIIAVGVNAAIFCGYQVNHIDLAPNHAGPLMGLANGFANLFSIAAPLVVHAVVGDDMGNKEKWRIIFIISAFFYIASNIFYVIFASGEIQIWNDALPEDDKIGAERLYKDSTTKISRNGKDIKYNDEHQ